MGPFGEQASRTFGLCRTEQRIEPWWPTKPPGGLGEGVLDPVPVYVHLWNARLAQPCLAESTDFSGVSRKLDPRAAIFYFALFAWSVTQNEGRLPLV